MAYCLISNLQPPDRISAFKFYVQVHLTATQTFALNLTIEYLQCLNQIERYLPSCLFSLISWHLFLYPWKLLEEVLCIFDHAIL